MRSLVIAAVVVVDIASVRCVWLHANVVNLRQTSQVVVVCVCCCYCCCCCLLFVAVGVDACVRCAVSFDQPFFLFFSCYSNSFLFALAGKFMGKN